MPLEVLELLQSLSPDQTWSDQLFKQMTTLEGVYAGHIVHRKYNRAIETYRILTCTIRSVPLSPAHDQASAWQRDIGTMASFS